MIARRGNASKPAPPPPVSWCRIFRVGPPCPKLCAECRATNARLTFKDRRDLQPSDDR